MFSALENILGETADIKRVIVGIGPGSYNGIRSAIAVAWGIATARGIPLVGISSLLGLDEGSYCAVGDARRGQYYLRARQRREIRRGAGTVAESPARGRCCSQTPDLPIVAPAPIEFLQGVIVRTPSAARLARLAADWEPNRPATRLPQGGAYHGPERRTKCS